MMVSKIAVIALVAIVACPILLGYGMNFDEVTEVGYNYSGDSINLTNQLINGGTGSNYTYAHGDITKLNTNLFRVSGTGMPQVQPEYENITTEYGSYPIFEVTRDDQFTEDFIITDYEFFYIEGDTNIKFNTYDDQGNLYRYLSVKSIFVYHHNGSYGSYVVAGSISGGVMTYTTYNNIVINKLSGGVNTAQHVYYSYKYLPNTGHDNDNYANLSAGFHLLNTHEVRVSPTATTWVNLALPDYTKQMTMTFNLDSITDPNYELHINMAPMSITRSTLPWTYLPMTLEKTTVGSDVKWTLKNECDSSAPVTELYLDPELTDNTYQITMSADSYYDESDSKYYVLIHVKASYVGSWPTLIGIANSYQDYELDYVIRDYPAFIYNDPISPDDLMYFGLDIHEENNGRTPIMRIDDALFRAFEYRTITDRTFLPTAFKQNPGVTLNNIKLYGSSITFGGITYAVTKGMINVNGKAVSVNNLTFNTVLNEDTGNYENKIGGVVVSTTASDPGMTFGGSWVASVTVSSMDSFTYTTTKWAPGHFAWDGMDQNFLMVGLITCLGVFIALGIYARKKGSGGLIPLMIAVGCAAMVFFIML